MKFILAALALASVGADNQFDLDTDSGAFFSLSFSSAAGCFLLSSWLFCVECN